MKEPQKTIVWNKLLPAIVLSAVILLSACAPAIPAAPVSYDPPPVEVTATSQPPSRVEAQVLSVEVKVLQTSPLQANAIVRGRFTEPCSTLAEPEVKYENSAFQIKVFVLSWGDQGCAKVGDPFETTIVLKVDDLPAGTYMVNVNGVMAVLTLPSVQPTTAISVVPSGAPVSLPVSRGCVDAASFVADVTIPDNSVIASDTPFTKTWRLRNTGTCTWDNSYLVYYISGTTMSQQPAYWIVQPGQTVAPGQSVDVSVGMTAPVADGNYASYWGLKKENGAFMPVKGGANGNSFYVKIRVNSGGSSGSITAASIDIVQEQGSGAPCTAGATYFVTAHLTADGPTVASYEIGSTAGQIPAGNFQTLNDSGLRPYVIGTAIFDEAGTKNISLRFIGPYPLPDDITVNLRVNGGEWYNTRLSCQ